MRSSADGALPVPAAPLPAGPVPAVAPGDVRRLDPRIAATRRRVFAATLDLIAEGGLSQATVDRVAERSGVSRSTIYRRWPLLAQLYYDAFASLARRTPLEVRGDTEAELLRYLEDYAERLADPRYCSVLLALLEASWRSPELAELRRRVFEERSSRAATIVDAGVRSGRLRSDLELRDALDAIVAPFLYRRLVEQQEIGQTDVRRLHADVLARFGAR